MFTLPKLAYTYESLEPYIDAKTMEIHLTKHHQAYVDNLNTALAKYPNLSFTRVEDVLLNIDALPQDVKQPVINNGGGHFNHSFFWNLMTPNPKAPSQKLLTFFSTKFLDLENFKTQVNQAAIGRFGSGWVWLVETNSNFEIMTTPNQDCPLLTGNRPILGIDVWEHAYYLKYQNRRLEYLQNWWNVVNWEQVESNLHL